MSLLISFLRSDRKSSELGPPLITKAGSTPVSYDCKEKNLDNSTRPPNVDRTVSIFRKNEVNQVDGEFKEAGRDGRGSHSFERGHLVRPCAI